MSEKSVPIEVQMRGSILKVSITIESILISIVYFSNVEQYKNRRSETLRLKNCMFSQKIERVKKVLSKYHPDLLSSNITLFKYMEEFKLTRNRMAHCAIDFGDSITNFKIWDISEDENNFQFYAPIETTVMETYATLSNAIDNIMPPLKNLLNEVQSRMKENYPEIYEILKSEDNSHQAR